MIRSDYRLPMLSDEGGTPDLEIVRGEDRPVPDADPPDSTSLALNRTPEGGVFYSLIRTPDGIRLRWPGRCLMEADEGVRRVVVHHEPGVDDDMIAVLVAGTLVSLHLVLGGQLVLHASAVDVSGAALAFVGAAGMGKSTVATLFGRAGHPLVTDDVLRVAPMGQEGTYVHRGGVELRLREHVSSLASGVDSRTTGDGRTAVDLPMTTSETLPLRACLIPRPSFDGTLARLNRLSAVDGMLALLRFPRLTGWTDGTAMARQFQLAGDLAVSTPVLVADIPWGPPFDPMMVDHLLQLLDEGEPW